MRQLLGQSASLSRLLLNCPSFKIRIDSLYVHQSITVVRVKLMQIEDSEKCFVCTHLLVALCFYIALRISYRPAFLPTIHHQLTPSTCSICRG